MGTPYLIAEAVDAAMRQPAGPIVADATQDIDPANAAARNATHKQSIRSSANLLRNMATVARKGHVHPLVQKAFTNETFDHAPPVRGLQGAGLTRAETALLRLLRRKAEK